MMHFYNLSHLNMPDSNMAIYASLASAGIGGAVALASAYVTNRFNRLRDDREAGHRRSALLRERGEELYSLTVNWLNGLFAFYFRRNGVMQGKLTYNQCLDLDIADGKNRVGEFGRIELLIDVYFPQARVAYDKVIENRTELNKVETAFKRAYETGIFSGEGYLGPYVAIQQQLEAAGDTLKDQIVTAIRNLPS